MSQHPLKEGLQFMRITWSRISVQILILFPTSYSTLGKLSNFPEPPFSC